MGLSVIEWWNAFAAQHLTEQQLIEIKRDKSADFVKRGAADACIQWVRGDGDLADFSGFLHEGKSLKELRAEGIDTSVVKSASVGEKANRIELRNTVGEWLDRLIDRTHGGVKQNLTVTVDAPPVVIAFGVMPGTPEMDALLPHVDAGSINRALESAPSTVKSGAMVEGTAIIDAETGVESVPPMPATTELTTTGPANGQQMASLVPAEE